MGNNDAGRAMAMTVEALWERRAETGLTALDVLDVACTPWKKTDVDFDDALLPGETFSEVLVEAFAPERPFTPEDDEYEDWWWDEVYKPFKDRYELW